MRIHPTTSLLLLCSLLASACATLVPRKPARDGVIVQLASAVAPGTSLSARAPLPVGVLCEEGLASALGASGLFASVSPTEADAALLEEGQILVRARGKPTVSSFELPAFFVEDAPELYRALPGPVHVEASFVALDASGTEVACWTCVQSAELRVQSDAKAEAARGPLLERARTTWPSALLTAIRADEGLDAALRASAERLASPEGKAARAAHLEDLARQALRAADGFRREAEALVEKARDRESELGFQETLSSMNSSISTAGSSDPLLGFRKSMNELQIRGNVDRIERARDDLLRQSRDKERLAQGMEQRAERARARAERLRDELVARAER